MAQTKKSMKGYVRRGDPNDTHDMNDLKVAGGKKSNAPNAKATRVSDGPVTRSNSAQDRHIANDTDFSSVDKDSTVSGTKRSYSHGGHMPAIKTESQPQPREHEEMTERPESEVGNEEEHGLGQSSDGVPNDPFKQGQQHNGSLQGVDEHMPRRAEHAAFSQHYVQGDSYPPTTSGNPSIPDLPEDPPSYSTHPPENHNQTKGTGTLPTRGGGGTRLPLGNTSRPVYTDQHHKSHAGPAVRNPAMPYEVPKLDNVMADVSTGFSFSRAPVAKPNLSRNPVVQPQQHGGASQSHQAVSNVAQRGSPAVPGQSARQDQRTCVQIDDHREVVAEPQKSRQMLADRPRRKSAPKHLVHPSQPVPVPPSRAPPVHYHQPTSRTVEREDLPVVDNGNPYEQCETSSDEEELEDEPEEEPEEEPDNLDYEAEEICMMNYAELKAEPFDVDPQADEFQLPEGQQQGPLAAKLQTVSTLSAKHQMSFFTSLPAAQWKEAGDWFLDQFGDVLKKFKTARQDKRKASKDFEDEIERRHEAVSKKRKVTEDALGEMKKTGAVVLQNANTPKKSKKTK